MLIQFGRLFIFVCLLANSVLAVELKESFYVNDMQLIFGDKVYLAVLLQDSSKNELLDLMKADLESGFLDGLYSEDPKSIDFDFVQQDIGLRVAENKRVDTGKQEFEKLYYVIKLKSTHEVIGSSEVYSNGPHDVELSMYIASKHARQGFAQDALKAELDFLEKVTKAPQAIWECLLSNPASIGLALKSGFVWRKEFLHMGHPARQYARVLSQ